MIGRRGGGETSHGLAAAGDGDFRAGLGPGDELGQAVLGFGDRDVGHDLRSIADG